MITIATASLPPQVPFLLPGKHFHNDNPAMNMGTKIINHMSLLEQYDIQPSLPIHTLKHFLSIISLISFKLMN